LGPAGPSGTPNMYNVYVRIYCAGVALQNKNGLKQNMTRGGDTELKVIGQINK